MLSLGPACCLWDYLYRFRELLPNTVSIPLLVVSTVLSISRLVRANESSGMSHKRMQREKDGSTFRFVSFRFVRLWLFSRAGSDSVLFPYVSFPSFPYWFRSLTHAPFFVFPLLCKRLSTQASPTHRRLQRSWLCDVPACQ